MAVNMCTATVGGYNLADSKKDTTIQYTAFAVKTRSKLDHKAWQNWFDNRQLNFRGQKFVTFSYYSDSTQVVYRGIAADASHLKICTFFLSYNIFGTGTKMTFVSQATMKSHIMDT